MTDSQEKVLRFSDFLGEYSGALQDVLPYVLEHSTPAQRVFEIGQCSKNIRAMCQKHHSSDLAKLEFCSAKRAKKELDNFSEEVWDGAVASWSAGRFGFTTLSAASAFFKRCDIDQDVFVRRKLGIREDPFGERGSFTWWSRKRDLVFSATTNPFLEETGICGAVCVTGEASKAMRLYEFVRVAGESITGDIYWGEIVNGRREFE